MGLVLLKRGLCGLDVESLPLPDGLEALVVDGWESFVTMSPKPS